MTDEEETVKAVTAKLTGEFYVGQRVHLHGTVNQECTVVETDYRYDKTDQLRLRVRLDDGREFTPVTVIVTHL